MRNTANPCKHVQSCESYTVWLQGMYIFILTVHILYEHGMMYLQVCPIEWMRMPILYVRIMPYSIRDPNIPRTSTVPDCTSTSVRYSYRVSRLRNLQLATAQASLRHRYCSFAEQPDERRKRRIEKRMFERSNIFRCQCRAYSVV